MKKIFTWIVQNKVASIILSLLIVGAAISVSGCAFSKHKHNFSDTWESNESEHWQVCKECDEKVDLEKHLDSVLLSDENNHYKQCSVCDKKYFQETHSFDIEEASADTLKTAATPTSKAQYYKKCECGYIYKGLDAKTFESGLKLSTIEITNEISKVYDKVEINDIIIETNNKDGDVKVEYKKKDALDESYTNEKPINAGKYTLRVIVSETSEFQKGEKTFDFEILKANTVISNIKDLSKTYDGKNISNIEYEVNQKESEAIVEYALVGTEVYTKESPKDYGKYKMRITILESKNYKSATEEKEFTIDYYKLNFSGEMTAGLVDELGYMITFFNGINNEKLAMKFRAKLFDGEDVALKEARIYSKVDFMDTYIYYVKDGALDEEVTNNYDLSDTILSNLSEWQGVKLVVGEMTNVVYAYVESKQETSLDFDLTKVKLNNEVVSNVDVMVAPFTAKNLNKTYILKINFENQLIFFENKQISILNENNEEIAVGKTITETAAKPVTLVRTNDEAQVIPGRGVAVKMKIVEGTLRKGEIIKIVDTNQEVIILQIALNNSEVRECSNNNVTVTCLLRASSVSDAPSLTAVLSNNPQIVARESVKAILTIRTYEEGGRKTPISSGYRPEMAGLVSSTVTISDIKVTVQQPNNPTSTDGMAFPGDICTVTITFNGKGYVYDEMSIFLREGGRTTAYGRILLDDENIS